MSLKSFFHFDDEEQPLESAKPAHNPAINQTQPDQPKQQSSGKRWIAVLIACLVWGLIETASGCHLGVIPYLIVCGGTYWIASSVMSSGDASAVHDSTEEKSSGEPHAPNDEQASSYSLDFTKKALHLDEDESSPAFESLLNVYFSKAKQFVEEKSNYKELLPLFYIVSDIAVMNSNKDRHEYAYRSQEVIFRELSQCAPYLTPEWFHSRTNLYASVLRGTHLRAEWFLGNPEDIPTDPITVCCFVFGDIIWNPNVAADYTNAPLMIHGIEEKMEFYQTIVRGLYPCVIDFFKAVYNL